MSHQKSWTDSIKAIPPKNVWKKKKSQDEDKERLFFPLIGIGMPMLFTLAAGSGGMLLGAGVIMLVVLMALFSGEQQD